MQSPVLAFGCLGTAAVDAAGFLCEACESGTGRGEPVASWRPWQACRGDQTSWNPVPY